MLATFCPDCTLCPRLASFLAKTRHAHPEYHCKPVAPFGEIAPKLLIVGLAPGMHGANRTGRPFTGDYAGILLYQSLFELGLSSAPTSVDRDDGLRLIGARITNAVKCLPPDNKPEPSEIRAQHARCDPHAHCPPPRPELTSRSTDEPRGRPFPGGSVRAPERVHDRVAVVVERHRRGAHEPSPLSDT